jgi:hypothetical protein
MSNGKKSPVADAECILENNFDQTWSVVAAEDYFVPTYDSILCESHPWSVDLMYLSAITSCWNTPVKERLNRV